MAQPGRFGRNGREPTMTEAVEDVFRRGVTTYRVRLLDRAGRIARPVVVFEAAGDVAAIARARALTGGVAHIEIWQGRRQLPPQGGVED